MLTRSRVATLKVCDQDRCSSTYDDMLSHEMEANAFPVYQASYEDTETNCSPARTTAT